MKTPCVATRLTPVAIAACVSVWFSAGVHAQSADLETVVVTATRTPVKKNDVVGDLIVIDREQIEQSQGQTVTEILRQQAGVQVSSNGGLGKSSNVYIRGTESRHVLLLIDGVRYGSATLGTPNWDNLPLSAIDRIEVLRGPAASLYGSDAVGGVVQIFTRKGVAGEFLPYVSSTLGSEGRRELSVGVSGGNQQFSYSLGGASVREKGFSATNPNAQFGNFNADRDGFSQQSMHGALQWQVAPGLELDFQVLVSSGDSQFDSSLNSSANFDVRGLTTTRTTGVGLAKSWANGGKTRLNVNRADDLTRNLYASTQSVFDTTRHQWGIQHEVATPAGALVVGAEQVREDVSGTTSYTVRKREIDGVFAGLQGALRQHLWQANVRRDDNSQFGAATTGSLAYGYKFLPGWTVTGSTGSTFKAPTFNQLYFPGFGNATTQPEKGRSHELALKYSAGSSDVRLTYFDQNIRGFITSSPTVSNVPRVTIDGWSLAASHVAGGWRFNANLEVLDARNRTPGSNYGRKLQRRADE